MRNGKKKKGGVGLSSNICQQVARACQEDSGPCLQQMF